jgi:hypothetical protein
MGGHLFIGMPSGAAIGIIEMEMQFATGDIPAGERAGWPMD